MPGGGVYPMRAELRVGTNLTDIVAQKKITIRELGGCMGPIWSSYYGNCHSLLFMVDASNPTQLSASCVQLLGLLSAEELAEASVLILFNKIITHRAYRCNGPWTLRVHVDATGLPAVSIEFSKVLILPSAVLIPRLAGGVGGQVDKSPPGISQGP
nr:ADP-ribosylation factor-like protein 16 isoform X3 [Odocoileus virginianus texanus]